MAARFNQELDRFRAGGGSVEALVDAIDQSYGDDGASLEALKTAIEAAYHQNHLPIQLRDLLLSRVDLLHQDDLDPGGQTRVFAMPPEATRVAAQPAEDAGRTQVIIPPETESPEDSGRTQVIVPAARSDAPAREPAKAPAADRAADNASTPAGTGSSGAIESWTGSGPSRAGGRSSRSTGPRRGAGEGVRVGDGDVLAGRFRLEEELGRGGMGVVYKARNLDWEAAADKNPFVAVKILSPEFSRHSDAVIALQREMRRVQFLNNDNIVRVYDFYQDLETDPPISFLAMEYLEGKSLDEYIRDLPPVGLTYEQARPLIAALCDGLAYAHSKGVVHSDFKPSNVFRTRDGEIKILDFGIARFADQEQAAGDFDAGTLGALTPRYAALEMFKADNKPDARDDVYALACVAYELLSGRHPFSGASAEKVRDKGLKAPPIRHLDRKRFKALQHGLALKREERCLSAEQFLLELDGRSTKRRWPVWFLSTAGLVLVAALAVNPVRNYLEGLRLEELLQQLRSTDPEAVEAALGELASLDPDTRDRFLFRNEVQRLVSGHFIAQAGTLVDEAQDKLNFRAAQAELQRGLELYPRDAELVQQLQTLEARRLELLSELNQTFNRYLEEGRFRSTGGGDDHVGAVLDKVSRIDPDNALLTDPRLPAAYARTVEEYLSQGDLGQARSLLAEAEQAAPDDPLLEELRGRLSVLDERRERERLVARAAEDLEDFRPEDLAQFRTRRSDLERLRRLAPEHPQVTRLSRRLEALLDGTLAIALEGRDWSRALDLVEEFEPLLDAQRVTRERQRVADARQGFEQRINGLLEETRRLGEAGRGAAALEVLDELRRLAPSHPAVDQARVLIAQGYLDRARQLRAEGRFDPAREQVAQARSLQAGTDLDAALTQELAQIDQAQAEAEQQMAVAERRRLQQQRQAAIQAAQARFRDALAAVGPAARGVDEALSALDALAGLDPADPLARDGRARIAQAVLAQAEAQRDEGDLDAALETVGRGLERMPGTEALSQAQADYQRQWEQRRLAEAQRQIAELRDRVEALLAQPWNDDNWRDTVLDGLQQLDSRMADDSPVPAQLRRRLADLHVQRAEEMLQAQRFAEARARLDEGRSVAPSVGGFTDLARRIDDAEASFRAEQEQRRVAAIVEGLKSDFATRVRANDVDAARQTLAQLGEYLADGDTFLTEQAPRDLADAYLRLAGQQAQAERFAAAIELLDQARRFTRDYPDLMARQDDYRREAAFADFRQALEDATPAQLAGLGGPRTELGRSYPQDYPQREAKLVTILVDRVIALKERDPKAALDLREAARGLFPDRRDLASIEIRVPSRYAAQGRKLVESGRLSEAEDLLTRALREEPDHPDVRDWRQALQARKNRAGQALDAFDEALADDDVEAARERRDRMLALWRDYPDARGLERRLDDLIRKLEEARPPSRYASQGLRLVESGKLSEAASLLDRARREEAGHPELDPFAEALKERRDRYEAVVRDFRRELDRKDAEDAQRALSQARGLWSDSRELGGLQQQLAKLKDDLKPVEPPKAEPSRPSPNPCRTRLAGRGSRPYGKCFDMLGGGQQGPEMVVIPAGGGVGQPFAISKYEISIGDYNRYCQASGECRGVRGSGSLPVTGISARDAQRYAAWLSRQTGMTYRLPTRGEWTHAATARGRGSQDYNCRLYSGSSLLKGRAMLSARSGKANGWGVANTVGNAQEWVSDGSGYLAVGGSYLDQYSNCSVDLAKRHGGGADEVTGFRLVRLF